MAKNLLAQNESFKKENFGANTSAAKKVLTFMPSDVVAHGKYRFDYFANMLRVADVSALLVASCAGYFIRFGYLSSPSPEDHLFIYLSTIVALVSLHVARSYSYHSISSLHTQLGALFVGGSGALLVILAAGFFSGKLHDYSRIWFLTNLIIAMALLLINRVLVTRKVISAIRNKELIESIVIVGANEHAEKMVNLILNTPNSPVQILGIFDDRKDRTFPASLQSRIVGNSDNLVSYVRNSRVDRIVVALPWIDSDRINGLLTKLRTVPVPVSLVPNDVVWRFPWINMERMGGIPVLTIVNSRINEQRGILKRAEDLLFSILILLLTSPLLMLIAIAVKLDSKGPILFKQPRYGYNNKIFEVYKFRSMKIIESPEANVIQATRGDQRITRVGRILRRSSLDELPQLFNVLMGNMSIVGPRPHAVQHNIQYGAVISEYFARHNVKPGITGWAQVNGLRGETDTFEKMHRRIDADLYYIEHWSLLLDFKIILLTVLTVWFQDTAY